MRYDAAHIQNVEDLKGEILNLRIRSERQKEHFHATWLDLKESVRPANLAKQALGVIKNAGKNNDLVKTALGLGGGAAARQILFGKSKGFFGKLYSAGVEIALSRFFSGRSGHGNAKNSSHWLELLTGKKSEPKSRIILGKSEARFDPPVRLLPATKE